MHAVVSPLRMLPVLLALWVGFGGSVTPVHAHHSSSVPAAPAHFCGQITTIVGPANNPTGFSLEVRKGRVLEMHLDLGTTLTALSAEAKVEGLQVNDYACVFARRVRKVWVATHVDFDVLPIDPRQVIFDGTVTRVSPNGRHVAIRTDAGDLRWIIIVPKTRFRIDGQLQVGLPSLAPGDSVEVRARRTNRGLVAVDVNLKTTGGERD